MTAKVHTYPQAASHRAGRLLRAGLVAAVTGVAALAASAAPTDGAPAHRHGAPHGEPMWGGYFGGGTPMGPLMGRQLDAVGASAEQRTQIRQIFEAARSDLKAQREAGRGLHEQQRTLFTQPTVDANAAEALRQQLQLQHDQASKRMLQAALDISRVLTPEQRSKLAQLQAERRARAESGERRGPAPR